jgi:hypothetical protein
MGLGTTTGADDSPPRVVLSCTARPEECARESAPKRKPSRISCTVPPRSWRPAPCDGSRAGSRQRVSCRRGAGCRWQGCWSSLPAARSLLRVRWRIREQQRAPSNAAPRAASRRRRGHTKSYLRPLVTDNSGHGWTSLLPSHADRKALGAR